MKGQGQVGRTSKNANALRDGVLPEAVETER